ncbi:MAG: glycosyltransferase [Verrucomicrobia bacterium]|nr:glycosyltransferase [Verrucomicrobiota bacterium]
MRVGVVVITFRRPAMLRQALQSIAKQTRLPDEVFISDNSPEPDPGVVKEFPELPIRYHHKKDHLPPEQHWLWAIQQPQTEFISILEDDNLYLPHHLQILFKAISENSSAVLAGSNALVFQNIPSNFSQPVFAPCWKINWLKSSLCRLIPRDAALAAYLFGSPFASSATLFRKEALTACKLYPSRMAIAYDRWMWTQIVSKGDVLYCPEITVLYRDHPIQLVKNSSRAIHRVDTRGCTKLIIAFIRKLGLSVEQVTAGMCKEFSFQERVCFGLYVFKQRDLALCKLFLPILLPELGFSRSMFFLSLRFLKDRLRERVSV